MTFFCAYGPFMYFSFFFFCKNRIKKYMCKYAFSMHSYNQDDERGEIIEGNGHCLMLYYTDLHGNQSCK